MENETTRYKYLRKTRSHITSHSFPLSFLAHAPPTAKMHFLSGIVVPILALAGAGQSAPTEAVSTDVEVPAKAVSSDGKVPQYYCAHTYHIMYTRYIVKGRGSPVHEKKLKKGISKAPLCSISGWNYHEADDGNGGNDFDLTVSSKPVFLFLLSFLL